MKTLSIILATTFVLGCGSAPSQEGESTTNQSSGDISLPPTNGGDNNPCDTPQFTKITENGVTYVVQVPTLCNEGVNPYQGDPGPDRGDPNPWDRNMNTYSQVQNQEMGQRSAR